MKKSIYRFAREFGIDPRATVGALKEILTYCSDLSKFKKHENHSWKIKTLFPCLHDKQEKAGGAKGHYFHQDLFIAGEIFKRQPHKHVDIGSRIDGFVAHVATFREIEAFDIRPLSSDHENILFKEMDIMRPQRGYENYTDSISCLHALEHFGLGRYGDNIDINGYKRGFENITRMLKKGGTFYFSVPIGKQRIEFNAHRIFSIKEVLALANKNGLEIVRFSYVDDMGDLHKDHKLIEMDLVNDLTCSFGCGIWEFKKK